MLWKICHSGKTRYNDVTYAAHLKLLEIRLFREHIFKAYNKLHNARHYWPFLTGSTGDRHVTKSHWWGNVSLSSPYHALSSTASWYLWRKYLQYVAYGKSRDPCPYVLRKLRLMLRCRRRFHSKRRGLSRCRVWFMSLWAEWISATNTWPVSRERCPYPPSYHFKCELYKESTI